MRQSELKINLGDGWSAFKRWGVAGGALLWAAVATADTGLLSARSRGTFNIGAAAGTLATTVDPDTQKTVLQFDFNAPAGTTAGVWTKDYPPEIAPTKVGRFRAGVKSSLETPPVTVALEIKGSKGVQRVVLPLGSGWSRLEKGLDWGVVGDLKEIVFVVSPRSGQSAKGVMWFDIDLMAGGGSSAAASAASLATAPERGMFNIGPADGKVGLAMNSTLNKEVVRFDFSVPEKSVAGVWTKGYPAALNAAKVNAVRWAFKTENPAQGPRLPLALEIKGTKDVQRVPLALNAGWTRSTEEIDWKKIGDLKEAVVVLGPVTGRLESGVLLGDVEFVRAVLAPKKVGMGLFDAAERGVFTTTAAARAEATAVFDESAKKKVLKLSYGVPAQAAAGVWTKGYAMVNPTAADEIRVAVKGPAGAPTPGAVCVLEIKGAKEVQQIPLTVGAGWTESRHAVAWSTLGDLKEVVFVVKGPDTGAKAQGGLSFSFEFARSEVLPRATAFGALDAQERGVFNIGSSTGDVSAVMDDSARKNVMKFSYAISPGAAAGVWTKSYPVGLTSDAVNTVFATVKKVPVDRSEEVSAVLELKGSRDVQRVPLEVRPEWFGAETPLDWAALGELKEAVLVVTPAVADRSARGALLFDFGFLQSVSSTVNGPFTWLNAAERGGFNTEPADAATVGQAFDEVLKKDVMKFEYTVSPAAAVGVWTKSYPVSLHRKSVDGVEAVVRFPDPVQGARVAVTVEVKGTLAVQSFPVAVQDGRGLARARIDWSTIGALKEAVVVVKPEGATEPLKGVLHAQLEFSKGDFGGPVGMPVAGKMGLVLLAGLLAYFVSAGLGKMRSGGGLPEGASSPAAGGGRDVVLGFLTAVTGLTSVLLYVSGAAPESVPAFGFLAVGAVGWIVAQVLAWVFARRSLTAVETFQHFVLSGLLGASASAQVLWQAPTSWSQVLFKSPLTVALVFALYHAANAAAFSSTQKSLKPVGGLALVGTPYLFGLLLSLQSDGFLQSLANGFTGGAFETHPEFLQWVGRVLVVFAFNEAVTALLGFATKGRGLKSARGHLLLFLVSVAVVWAPRVADAGSSAWAASLSALPRALVAVGASMVSQAGLWMEVYLITGMVLDAIYGYPPARDPLYRHAGVGLQKGLSFSFLFLGLLYGVKGLVSVPVVVETLVGSSVVVGVVLGGLLFPLAKAIVESFDGSMSFFRRAVYSYKQGPLYARGAVVGAALAWGLTHGVPALSTGARLGVGALMGIAASAGVSFVRDGAWGLTRRGKIQTWKIYLVDGGLGGFIGAALAFYLDTAQIPVLVEKFKLYTGVHFDSQNYTVYALLSKWGRVDLGAYTGGARLFFSESLAGVITWSIAAWLFAVNRVFMIAYFQKDKQPIRQFFSKDGFAELGVNMIHVMRWGLWMAPIINTGLRMMAQATWYNQDGAVRTLLAIFKNATLSPADFQTWSLNLFVALLSYDLVRILIWIDHMGLRVATLVNLSFLGMDKLDEKLARFIGPSAAQRYIPEGVKRFTTWAPLLIPFYIPRGAEWDYAWDKSTQIQKAAAEAGGFVAWARSLSGAELAAGALGLWAAGTLYFMVRRWRRSSRRVDGAKPVSIANREYRVTASPTGAATGEILAKGYDLSRRSYDTLDPCGRALFVVDTARPAGQADRAWPVLGNFPRDRFSPTRVEGSPEALRWENTAHGVRTELDVRLPDLDTAAELWTVTLENTTDAPRTLKLVPYLEWVLDRPDGDKGHTQYGRLFPEMEYVRDANAILAWQKKTKSMGFLAGSEGVEGFCTSRMDFIGRARSLWSPRLLETLHFLDARDTGGYPTFDPIGSLLVQVTLAPRESKTLRFLAGYAKNRDAALNLIQHHLAPQPLMKPAKKDVLAKGAKTPLIGHGEIPPGTPQPYSEFINGGNTLLVKTPFTPRPYDHALSNAVGHYVMVTNRGLHTTSNGNSQQNPVTPDWPDTVTRELPAEAIYLYDVEEKEWYSPTHHPLNDHRAKHTAEFGVDGTALFRMTQGTLSTELTVFVPPREPLGVYLLTVKNNGAQPRRVRMAPYFQFALVGQGESRPRPLILAQDKTLDAVYYENPVNAFRAGPAFASISLPAERVETRRGRFFGTGRGVDRPALVENGEPDFTQTTDNRAVAGFLTTLDLPAGESRTVVVVMGQTDNQDKAAELIKKYKDPEAARASLEETRRWWLSLVGTVKAETSSSSFDQLQNWLKYQAVAERIWARRGFYQTSGAYGFRDQLQDSVNLVWVDPALARKQILLHASQQFIEGDVVHWFHTLHDGRTAFSNRSHASDNLLWLAWGVADYLRMTGDESILEEMTTYLRAENPFLPLPHNKHGWGTIYPRSTRADTVYRHCMKSIDLVLDKRMGAHGIPLIATGDWNDGLDEIGSEGRGESVWLGFFLLYILKHFLPVIEKKDGPARREHYLKKLQALEAALATTWREDRYLRAIHDDGTEIGIKDSGVWEIDALTAAWAVMSDTDPERARTVFQTALNVLERDNVILLGWPALREDTKPYLGRSSHYPEGVRENGMYSHGVQWLVKAARLLAEKAEADGDSAAAQKYRDTAYRLWMKIAPILHTTPQEIEIYGGQPNKQAADLLTTFDQGRMIWHGYTGAAGWMLRQALEGVVGASLHANEVVLPADLKAPRGDLQVKGVGRDLSQSPLS